MKTVSVAEFLAGLEGVVDSDTGQRATPELLWPPTVVGGDLFARHVSGEIWRTTP